MDVVIEVLETVEFLTVAYDEIVWDGEEVWLDAGSTEELPWVTVCDSVTGHTVVYKETSSVVTCPILPGQSVTVGAQEVIV